jgi:hypothetical protein
MAIEYVTYFSLEPCIDPFGERNHLVDSDVLIEIVRATSERVILGLVPELERSRISPGRFVEILLARS